jgi:hypothetical protein
VQGVPHIPWLDECVDLVKTIITQLPKASEDEKRQLRIFYHLGGMEQVELNDTSH